MPLLFGKKNIYRNAQVEMKHGKPRAQAFAIAFSVYREGMKRGVKKAVKRIR